MTAFDYEFDTYPHEEWFDRPILVGQINYLKAVKEGSMVTGRAFRLLCNAILEDVGLTERMPETGFPAVSQGAAGVLILFFKGASARHRRAAERKAWD